MTSRMFFSDTIACSFPSAHDLGVVPKRMFGKEPSLLVLKSSVPLCRSTRVSYCWLQNLTSIPFHGKVSPCHGTGLGINPVRNGPIDRPMYKICASLSSPESDTVASPEYSQPSSDVLSPSTSLYGVRFRTSQVAQSGLSAPSAGVQFAIFGEGKQMILLDRLGRKTDAASRNIENSNGGEERCESEEMQRIEEARTMTTSKTDSLTTGMEVRSSPNGLLGKAQDCHCDFSNDGGRFESGSLDWMWMEGPSTNVVEAFWVAPESGTWRLETVELLVIPLSKSFPTPPPFPSSSPSRSPSSLLSPSSPLTENENGRHHREGSPRIDATLVQNCFTDDNDSLRHSRNGSPSDSDKNQQVRASENGNAEDRRWEATSAAGVSKCNHGDQQSSRLEESRTSEEQRTGTRMSSTVTGVLYSFRMDESCLLGENGAAPAVELTPVSGPQIVHLPPQPSPDRWPVQEWTAVLNRGSDGASGDGSSGRSGDNQSQADRWRRRAESMEEYGRLKKKLLVTTVAFGVAGTAAAGVLADNSEVAEGFAVGAVASVLYLLSLQVRLHLDACIR
eukprot:TRINITY_DN1889_c0_g1_i3.p1 TRINITY_DN1889_c0_g1~~TRINITY_DN1889_c0_g1_i3.p1  ORF type:complete len:561 (-),score=69.49 TRINITY_DN1889_c0_g1_i3:346-2028(-)